MKKLKDYLAESSASYNFVIKFANEPTQEQLDTISTWLKRYDLKEMSTLQLIEHNTKDFIDIQNRKVFSVDIKLGMPVTQYILLQDLTRASAISEKFMIVRSQNEPLEIYSKYDIWSAQQNAAEKLNGFEGGARLSTDREYLAAEQPIVDPLFGDEYNKKFLAYLAGVEANRPKQHANTPSQLFSWLQLEDIAPGEPKQDTSDFNAHIDTPKPVSNGSKENPVDNKFLNSQNTMSNNSIPVVKFYKDPTTGKAKQVIKPLEKK